MSNILNLKTGEPFDPLPRLHHRPETSLAVSSSEVSPRSRGMLLAAKSFYIGCARLKWRSVFTFSNDKGLENKVWFSNETRSFGIANIEDYIADGMNGSGAYFFNNGVEITNLCFRVRLSATIIDSPSNTAKIIADRSIGSISTRAFTIGCKNGKMYQNMKMNGNNSASMFNDLNPPLVLPTVFTSLPRHIWEMGVRPQNGKYVAYTAIDGVDSSVGQERDGGDFSTGNFLSGKLGIGYNGINAYGCSKSSFDWINFDVLDL